MYNIMKEIISAFLAISILSVGGLGLYMYNNKDDVLSDDGDEKYNKHENYNENEELNYEIFEEKQPKHRKNKIKVNTKRNRKNDGTRRRY